MNKNPREKKEYTIGIMTGVHRECSEGIVDAIIEVFREKDLDVHFVLFQGIDTRRYLDLDPNSQGIIDSHYFSVYEYGKFIELDLIIAAFGTVTEGPKRMSAEEFFAPFKDIPVILLETLETIDECESTRNGRVMEPPLTAVEQDFSPLANQVRESAISLIQGEQANVVTLPAELIVRGSCGCKAKEVATKKDEGPIDMSVAEDHERCSIATSLILRGIDDTELDPKSCYLRLADSLKSIGATFICICTLDEPYTVSSEDKFFLPETLNVDLILEDGEIETYLDNEKGIDEVAPALSLRRHKDKHLAVFPLTYRREHFGVMFVELSRSDYYFYYTLSLQIGTGIAYVLREINSRKKHQELMDKSFILDYTATHDALTGCYTRSAAMEMSLELMKDNPDHKFVFAINDVDHLKSINDNYGHQAGDDAIRNAVNFIKQAVVGESIIGRAGGDEFICIFEDGGRFTASDYAIRVKQLCQDFNNQSDKPYYVDISIGYHCFLGKDYKGIRNIIRKADDRLNHAKAFRRKSAIKAYAAGDKNDIFSYLENSAEILRLYVPQMQHIETEDDYIKTLIGNYIRIRSIAKDNMEIMERVYLPMINSRRDISRDEIGIIRRFSTGLHDAYAITSLDGWLAYHQAKRIYEEAVEEDDDNLLVWALDELVTTSYGMMCMAGKLYPISEIYERYHKVGLEAAEKLLGFLEPEKFIRLPEELKKQVLINSRYIRVVSEVEGVPAESKQMETLIERMKKALALSKCSFYRKNVPTYDWKLHEFRTLEYISTLTDFNNENNVRKEDIAFINESSKLLKKMYEGADGLYRKSHITGELGVSCNRNEYLAGELSIRDYKDRLAEIVVSNHSNDDRQKLELSTLQAIAEYHLVLNEDNIDDEDRKNLRYFYQVLVDTIQQTTGSGRLVFIGPPLIHILKNFVELTESMSFKDIGLTLLATVHPPSYAHSLTVADLSVCIAKKLIGKQPEVFIGMPGCRSQEDVCRHGQEILEYVYNAALTHDFGKLFVLETILTYGRNLSDEEFEFIKLHPLAGSNILSLHKSTSRYANVAKGHHKWYDNNHGYPKEFDIDSSEYKPVIYIVSCADSLDAATDEIGRSYKKSLTLEDVIQEIEADRGSRYAPYVVDLLSEESVVEELRGILKNNRAENYKKVYRRIRNSDTKYKQEGLLPRVAMKE